MTQDPTTDGRGAGTAGDGRTTRFLGSLKEALVAASREDTSAHNADGGPGKDAGTPIAPVAPPPVPVASAQPKPNSGQPSKAQPEAAPATVPSAASAAKAARGTSRPLEEQEIKLHKLPTTRVVKANEVKGKDDEMSDAPARTELVRGKMKVERGEFDKDPVVGWVVVVGGPGIGSYRPIFEGNNSVGRGSINRIPIDFGDEAISSEEQAYIRYDSSDRSFLFVPNLAKTNVVSVNNEKPTGAVALNQMDVIQMGRTQLVFVPFCGSEFDWSALGETTKA